MRLVVFGMVLVVVGGSMFLGETPNYALLKIFTAGAVLIMHYALCKIARME